MEPEEFEIKLNEFCQKSILALNPLQRPRAGMAFRKFRESLGHLYERGNEVYFAERELVSFDGRGDKKLVDLQENFVHKTEAFHQQIYTTISAFIGFLNHICPDNYREVLSMKKCIKSVKYFLTRLKEIIKSDEEIDLLLASHKFRSEFIEHTQQHKVHDYMTFTSADKGYIIYFRNEPGENSYQLDLSTITGIKDFKTPIKASHWFLSPHYNGVADALLIVFIKLFELING